MFAVILTENKSLENELQKASQKEFREKKVIKINGLKKSFEFK